MDLSFQDIDKELCCFSSMYGPPHGLFLISFYNGSPAGGVGLRKLEGKICEMKRLFVYDRFKDRGVGHGLCSCLIGEARNLGYKRMRLDTLEQMSAAIRLYKSLGFKEIESYYFNPVPTARYMELNL